MNEHIAELYRQAHKGAKDENGNTPQYFSAEKFAKLIVRECAQYMYEHYPHTRYEINYMRKHMGDLDWNKSIGVE